MLDLLTKKGIIALRQDEVVTCRQLTFNRAEKRDLYTFLGNCPPTTCPKPTLTLTSHLKPINVGLGEGRGPRGGPGFFLGGGALLSCSTSTPINHIGFFLQNTSCIRKLRSFQGGGGAYPLHPPPRSAPGGVDGQFPRNV